VFTDPLQELARLVRERKQALPRVKRQTLYHETRRLIIAEADGLSTARRARPPPHAAIATFAKNRSPADCYNSRVRGCAFPQCSSWRKAMVMTTNPTEQISFAQIALAAAGRAVEIPESADVYGWLVGSWDLEVLR
jgi:hypothetical protein